MEEKSNPIERVEYYDFIKVLAIYFVCFYHFNNLDIDILTNTHFSTYLNYFIIGIASTGVPLFFMINGALMLNKGYNFKKHIHKTLNLVILTGVWAVITLLVLIPIFGDSYTPAEFIKALWSWKLQRTNHLWFLPALFGIYILFPLIKEVFDKQEKKLTYFFLSVVFIFTFGNVLLNNVANVVEWLIGVNYLTENINFFSLFNIFYGDKAYSVVYFILGGLLVIFLNKQKAKISTAIVATILMLSMLLLFAYGVVLSYSNDSLYDTVWNGYDTVMTLSLTISIFILCSKLIVKNQFLSLVIDLIGKNTLGIYLVHVPVGSLLALFYNPLDLSQILIINVLFGLVVMLLSLLVVVLLKKLPVIKLLFKL